MPGLRDALFLKAQIASTGIANNICEHWGFGGVAPSVTAGSVPASSTELAIAITGAAGTDNIAITDWWTGTTTDVPSLSDAGWHGSATPPTSHTVAGSGTYHVYLRARDAVGNIAAYRDCGQCVVFTGTLGVYALTGMEFGEGPDHVTTTPAVNTQASGSLIIAGGGIYDLDTEGEAPTDNKSNTYTQLGSTVNYYNFYPPSGCKLWQKSNAAGGTGHTWTKGCDTGGEATIGAVEIIGASGVQDVSGVARDNGGTNGSWTSGTVTTTGPAILLCFVMSELWFTANPTATNWTLLVTYNGSGSSIQGSILARTVESAGTYSVTVNYTGPSQGAVLFIVAVQ